MNKSMHGSIKSQALQARNNMQTTKVIMQSIITLTLRVFVILRIRNFNLLTRQLVRLWISYFHVHAQISTFTRRQSNGIIPYASVKLLKVELEKFELANLPRQILLFVRSFGFSVANTVQKCSHCPTSFLVLLMKRLL